MTGRKDPYRYVRCNLCGNIFRVVASGLTKLLFAENPFIRKVLDGCPECGGLYCTLTTRKEWKKSNEVKPDKNDNV